MEKLILKTFENEFVRLRTLRTKVIEKVGIGCFHKKMCEKTSSLEKKYGRNFLTSVLSFHVIVGSSPLIEETKSVDLLGEDSLENFLKNLLN